MYLSKAFHFNESLIVQNKPFANIPGLLRIFSPKFGNKLVISRNQIQPNKVSWRDYDRLENVPLVQNNLAWTELQAILTKDVGKIK
jgi:hypothetical protein